MLKKYQAYGKQMSKTFNPSRIHSMQSYLSTEELADYSDEIEERISDVENNMAEMMDNKLKEVEREMTNKMLSFRKCISEMLTGRKFSSREEAQNAFRIANHNCQRNLR